MMTKAGSVLEDIEYDDIVTENRDQTAFLFIIDGEEVWLNNDLTELDEDRQIVTVPKWYAKKKGISKL